MEGSSVPASYQTLCPTALPKANDSQQVTLLKCMLFILYQSQPLKGSQMAQLVKNPPTMRETWVQYLGWEDPLEKGTATPSSILTWKISWTV